MTAKETMSSVRTTTRVPSGKPPGTRAKATRRRLIECTAEMLAQSSYRDLSVATISRLAETSPATFYRYFEDVYEPLLLLAEGMLAGAETLQDLVADTPWDEHADRRAKELVDGFFDFWDENRDVIRVVEFLADDGERQFERVRARLLRGLTNGLADAIAESRPDLDGVNPRALSVGLVAMMAQAARYGYAFDHWELKSHEVRDALVHVVAETVTGTPMRRSR